MIFFTSDNHFSHNNILLYANRPFSSVEDMDEEMIKCWNEKVCPHDIVYHLGDFTLKDNALPYIERLNGFIQFVVPEFHHDKYWLKNFRSHKRVKLLTSIYQIMYENIWVILCHYPFHSWEKSHYNSYHLFGHCHNQYKPLNLSLDIGVDSAYNVLGEFCPFSFDEIFQILSRRVIFNEQKALD